MAARERGMRAYAEREGRRRADEREADVWRRHARMVTAWRNGAARRYV